MQKAISQIENADASAAEGMEQQWRGRRVLEVGVGDGWLGVELLKSVGVKRYLGVDLSSGRRQGRIAARQRQLKSGQSHARLRRFAQAARRWQASAKLQRQTRLYPRASHQVRIVSTK